MVAWSLDLKKKILKMNYPGQCRENTGNGPRSMKPLFV